MGNQLAMTTTKIHLSDFTFRFSGYGHYKITYRSPVTGRKWTRVTDDMPLVDRTKNCDNIPKRIDLEQLRRICKC